MSPLDQTRTSEPPPRLSADNPKDLILALAAHQDYIDNITRSCCVEADIRARFYRLRIIRAKYSEWSVRKAETEYDAFMSKIKRGGVDLLDLEQTGEEFKKIQDEIDRTLGINSRIFKEDCYTAQADVPDQFFMDHYRRITDGRSLRAPNGEMLAEYGLCGEPVKPSFATIRASDDDFFRHLFLHKLIDHFKDYVYIPGWKLYNKVLRRKQKPEPQGLGGRSIELVVTAVECIIFVFCLGSSVTLLSYFNSIWSRIITASLYSLASPYVVVFFSKEAKGMFMLILAFWGVMAVFVAANSSVMKST